MVQDQNDKSGVQVEAKQRDLSEARELLSRINKAIEDLEEQAKTDENFDPSSLSTEQGRKRIVEERIRELEEELSS